MDTEHSTHLHRVLANLWLNPLTAKYNAAHARNEVRQRQVFELMMKLTR
jgi:hypothetical protein